ncbi:hypothetical protein UFOVP953_44 [uncultured Caudovirales phage]|uniref:Recombination endonuclease VII n=1 Tax=uncultured Caudovirales phage TaxID=2100421 RepID=A0A6J5PV78_9CAUD|nr:hypothetical protein UFOVP953_44 [uncultured Caudovirales phage]
MARFKECFKCKTVQPLTEFYKHQAMADGHLNKCKTCTKNDVATHRLQNIEKIRAYDRRRAKLPKRAKAAQEISAAWKQADKRRMKAHNAVARALKAGKLVRQPCIRCGKQKSIAHHEDYDYSLKVMWLCQPCHKQRHKELNASSF